MTKSEANTSLALGKFYSPKLVTEKRPNHLVMTSQGTFQVQEDGSYKPWKRT